MPTAQQQLDTFLAKYDPKIARLGRQVLAHMGKRVPGAINLVYDNYNALVIGFGPAAKVSATPLSVALYPRWINLFFLMGAALPDPDGILQGKGSRVRSVRITSLADLKDERVDAMISAAVMHVGWKLDPKSKPQLVIQSVSKKQRPRRP